MKTAKILVSLILALAICISLCSCRLKQEDAVGTWSGSYEYNGNQFFCTFALLEDGTYSKIVYKNDSFSSSEIGTYEVKSNKVILHENGNLGGSTEYKYQSGKLVNNKHKFAKE